MPESDDKPQLTLTTPLGPGALEVDGFSGTETVSEPFLLHLELSAEGSDLDFDALMGQPATLTVARTGGEDARHFHALVVRCVLAGSDARRCRYLVELRPWLWLLSLDREQRIFQQQSVPDILERVFAELGFRDYRMALSGAYAAREYCVQYAESSLDFVSRLMEEEGIFYFFEHTEQAHTLVLADDRDGCPAGVGTLRYPATDTAVPAADELCRCTLEQVLVSQVYRTDDYNFETPGTELRVDDGEGPAVQRVYEYPGGYDQRTPGESRARVRLQALGQGARRLRGASAAYGLSAGHRFSLQEHPRAEANTEYMVLGVSHQATRAGYTNSLEALPLALPYRPPRRTPRPTIAGGQTASVVGKDGEEIWTDAYGRVKVRFHWDQGGGPDEDASCWIRVAQVWAGAGWGALFVPRVGQEVVVTFLEGDPDRPLITGAVYNAEQLVPCTLPTEATRSTLKSQSSRGGGGFNELRFEDKKDAEELYLHAQKDLNVEVLNDRSLAVGNDDTTTVKNNRATTVEAGDDSVTVSQGNRVVSVAAGDETLSVAGARAVDVGGDESHASQAAFSHRVGGNYRLEVGGDLEIQVTGNITIRGMRIGVEADTEVSTKAGTSLNQEAGTGLTSKAGTTLLNQAGTTLTSKASASLVNQSEGSILSTAASSHDIKSSGVLALAGSVIKLG